MEEPLKYLAENAVQIKWLLVALLGLITLCMVLLAHIFSSLRKIIKAEQDENEFRMKARELLNMNDLEGVIRLASERLSRFPGEIFAHWYLGQAYYQKRQWQKALAEFNYIYEMAPSWRQRFVNPFIYEIKEQLQSTKPEIIKN